MTSMEYSYQPERANWFTRFLWHSAGADSQLLNRCPKSDQVKYECLGGLVLSTSVLAFMSGSYAIYVAFSRKDGAYATSADWNSLGAALVVGLFWAFVIYNLERFIVSSMGKVDDTGAITWPKIARALPRVVLSVIVGTVLAAPLEVRILEKEVQAKVSQEVETARLALEDQYRRDTDVSRYQLEFEKRFRNLAVAEKQVSALEIQLRKKENNYALAAIARSNQLYSKLREDEKVILKTLTDASGNYIPRMIDRFERTTKQEIGSAALGTGLAGRLDQARRTVNNLRSNSSTIAALSDFDNTFYSVPLKKKELEMAKVQNKAGLAHQLKIIHGGDYSQIVIMLRLLLIIIETSPIFFKMMVSRSTYEVLLDSQQRISSAQQGVLRGGLVTLDGRLVPTSELSIAASAYEAELRRRSETEARLADEVHRVIRERRAEEIREHPEDYYTSGSTGTSHSPRTVSSTRYTAHTDGYDPADPYGRRYVTHPSGSDRSSGPGDTDPGMGYVGVGGAMADPTAERIHFTRSEDITRYASRTPIEETVVLGADTSAESTESHSSEITPVVGAADSSSTATRSAETYSSTLFTDETTTSGTGTPTDAVSDSAVVDSSSTSSSSSVDLETVVTPLFTEALSEESLGHEEVVSPAVVILDDSELEFAVAGLVTADDSTSRSVDSISDADASESGATTSLDSSVTRVDSETLMDSSADVTSAGSIDESVAVDQPETSVSGPLDVDTPSEGEIPNDELLLTTVRTEDLPVDDTPAESPAMDVDPRTTRTPDTHELAK